MLARMSHPMHTYLLGLRRIRAFVARLTHAKQNHTGNRLPIAGLTSDSTQTGKHGNRMPIAGLTSDSEPTNTHTRNQLPIAGLTSDSNQKTGNRMPIAGLTSDSHQKRETTHTKGLKKKKGARRDQLISCLRTSSDMRIRAT